MKIAIIGAGAIGSLLGGVLARAGHEITLIGKKPHMEAISRNGLEVDGALGEFRVQVSTAQRLTFTPEMLFLTSKTQDVEALCRMVQPHAGGIPVLVTQNGVRSIYLAGSLLGKSNIIGCILLLNARLSGPGKVTYVNQRPIVLGEAFSPQGQRIKEIQSILSKVAETHLTDNLIGAQWTKLLINALSNSLDAMTGLPLRKIIDHPPLLKIGVLILKEALRIVEKAGIRLEKLPDMPVSIFKTTIKMPMPLAAFIMKKMIQSQGNPDIVTSTLQSIRRGKKTEIDYLNGEFVSLGQKLNLPVPYNSTVVELVHQVEKTGRFFTPQELAARFLEFKPQP